LQLAAPSSSSLCLTRTHSHPPHHSFPTRRSSDLNAVANSPALIPATLANFSSCAPPPSTACAIVIITREIDDPPASALMPTEDRDRKSTRLNSSHVKISYAVFCLKKKNKDDGHAN